MKIFPVKKGALITDFEEITSLYHLLNDITDLPKAVHSYDKKNGKTLYFYVKNIKDITEKNIDSIAEMLHNLTPGFNDRGDLIDSAILFFDRDPYDGNDNEFKEKIKTVNKIIQEKISTKTTGCNILFITSSRKKLDNGKWAIDTTHKKQHQLKFPKKYIWFSRAFFICFGLALIAMSLLFVPAVPAAAMTALGLICFISIITALICSKPAMPLFVNRVFENKLFYKESLNQIKTMEIESPPQIAQQQTDFLPDPYLGYACLHINGMEIKPIEENPTLKQSRQDQNEKITSYLTIKGRATLPQPL